ncbi:MAG: glycosyltransferase [Barnesiella sp.]
MLFTIIDYFIFCVIALYVLYNAYFTFYSFFPRTSKGKKHEASLQSFAVIFPAYKEDAVILDSVRKFLDQDYPQDRYKVIVVSDKMTDETNRILSELPVKLLIPDFKQSLKSKAIKFALDRIEGYDKVIILDADNIVGKDFLKQVNNVSREDIALQLHRTWKNCNTSVAVWDAVAEEINNTIYRKGHVNAGFSSAVIGSGIVFDFNWIKENIGKCTTFAEDKEMEVLLAKEGIFVNYGDKVYVYDEKTATEKIFFGQRIRWAHSQTVVLASLLKAMKSGAINKNMVDKFFQWIPFPKQIRFITAVLFAVIWSFVSFPVSVKWWSLIFLEMVIFAIAIPFEMYNRALFMSLLKLPVLICVSVRSYVGACIRMYRKDMSFNNTPHQNVSSDE